MVARLRLCLALGAATLLATTSPAQTPVESEVATLLPALAGGTDKTGEAVAMGLDQVLVGAPNWDDGVANPDLGAVWVFAWNGSAWLETTPLLASDGRPSDHFGSAIALKGDLALVGARGVDTTGNEDQGAAYVLRHVAGGWVEEQKLHGVDGQPGDGFGLAVAVDGEFALVGAPGRDVDGNLQQGSASIFRWNGVSWDFVQELVASDGDSHDAFGDEVALTGDRALVAAAAHDHGILDNQGAVYAYRWNGATWIEEQKLEASDGAAHDQFGSGLAADGDVAVVGAQHDDVPAQPQHGSAYTYRWTGTKWAVGQKLVPDAGEPDDEIGGEVAVSGDVLVLGAAFDLVGAHGAQGSAWVYRRGAAGWTEEQHLIASEGQEFEHFGRGVAVAGNVAVVGAPEAQPVGLAETGVAHVFDLLGPAWAWLGLALSGTAGEPVLSAFGDLSPGSSVSLALGQARPAAPVLLVLGLSALSAPFKGGVLVPGPDVVVAGLVTDGEGELTLGATWPAGVPAGTPLWVQAWIADPAGPAGFAASNGVVGTAP